MYITVIFVLIQKGFDAAQSHVHHPIKTNHDWGVILATSSLNARDMIYQKKTNINLYWGWCIIGFSGLPH